MTTLALTKHQALGNDFLVTFHTFDDAAQAAEVARRACHRRRGIGADGLLVGVDEPGRALTMTLYNADGSVAEISGNGIRCFAQAVAMRRGAFEPQTIITGAGERQVDIRPVAPRVVEATVSMGRVHDIAEPLSWASIGADPVRPVAHLSVGNPHCVVGVDDITAVDLVRLGAALADVNLEIVEPTDQPHVISMRVHERGAGITEACGSGAVASAAAALRWGLVPASCEQIVVQMPGGDAKVSFTADGEAMLTGPSEYLAAIQWEM